jgi:hypothetical protein
MAVWYLAGSGRDLCTYLCDGKLGAMDLLLHRQRTSSSCSYGHDASFVVYLQRVGRHLPVPSSMHYMYEYTVIKKQSPFPDASSPCPPFSTSVVQSSRYHV